MRWGFGEYLGIVDDGVSGRLLGIQIRGLWQVMGNGKCDLGSFVGGDVEGRKVLLLGRLMVMGLGIMAGGAEIEGFREGWKCEMVRQVR